MKGRVTAYTISISSLYGISELPVVEVCSILDGIRVV